MGLWCPYGVRCSVHSPVRLLLVTNVDPAGAIVAQYAANLAEHCHHLGNVLLRSVLIAKLARDAVVAEPPVGRARTCRLNRPCRHVPKHRQRVALDQAVAHGSPSRSGMTTPTISPATQATTYSPFGSCRSASKAVDRQSRSSLSSSISTICPSVQRHRSIILE